MNRRNLLRLLAAAPVGVSLSKRRAIFPSFDRNVQLSHGLLFGDERIPDIRSLYLNDSFFADLLEHAGAVDRDDTRRFIESGLRLNDQLTDLPRLGDTAEKMALHYLLTEDRDAGELAKECVRAMLRFPKWDYFLDGDEVIGVQRAPAATIAVALTSDWLGDSLSPDERREWLEIMGERGCLPCYRSLYDIQNPRQVTGWRFDPESTITILRPGNFTDLNRRPEITAETNLRAIPACGLIMGAAAYGDIQGKQTTAESWIVMGTDTVEAFGKIYKPDGSYHEGVSYANYTSEHLTQAITVLLRKRKNDLRKQINWIGHADYLLNMSMATTADAAEVVNFGDNGNPKTGSQGSVARTSVPLWIAGNTKSEGAQWFAKNLAGSPNLRSLIFFDQSVDEKAARNEPTLWESDLDWIVARNGYRADDLVVAMRSGGPANHEHADRNSIVVKCFGEHLVTDPYRPPYSFSDPAWTMRLTQGHSAVLIDGIGHEHHNGVEGTNASQSAARIISSAHNSNFAMWTSDASQPYRLVDLKIASVVRTVVVLFEIPAVIVVDRVVKREDASTMEARFFGFNWDGKVRQDAGTNGFTVERPGAAIRATCYSRNEFQVRQGRLDIVEERAERHPFVEVATVKGMEQLLVTAMGIGRNLASAPKADLSQTAEQVVVSFGDRSVFIDHDGRVSVV